MVAALRAWRLGVGGVLRLRAPGPVGARRARRRALIAWSPSRSAGVGCPPRTPLVAAALPVGDHVPKDTGNTDSATI